MPSVHLPPPNGHFSLSPNFAHLEKPRWRPINHTENIAFLAFSTFQRGEGGSVPSAPGMRPLLCTNANRGQWDLPSAEIVHRTRIRTECLVLKIIFLYSY